MAETQQHPGKTGHWQRLPRWKKWLLAIALVFTGVGGAFAGYNAITASGGAHATRDSSDRPSIKADDEAERRLSQGLAPSEDSGSPWPTLPPLPGDPGTGDSQDGESEQEQTTTNDSQDARDLSSSAHWPGALFRLGFGFFAGFAIGYATRAFLRITILAVGLLLLGLFGLQYAGLINVEWAAMETVFNHVVNWLRTNTADFRNSITGQLPSTAAGLGGLLVGFKK
jgi:uncharacterized membrane protein (Fun14 family)